MPICPECKTENPENARFCLNCGKKLEIVTKEDFIPSGNLNDFKADLDLLKKLTADIKKIVNDSHLTVKTSDGQEGINAQVNLKLEQLQNEIDIKKNAIAPQLKVLNPDIVTTTILQKTEPPYNVNVSIDVDKNELEKYVNYYKNANKNITNNRVSNVNKQNKSKSAKVDLNLMNFKFTDGVITLHKTNSPVVLKKDESAFLVLNNISMLEPRAVRKTKGTYGGPTVRLAKGLSFRLGQSSSTSVSHDELKVVDTGTLTLTNKRLIYIGKNRTNNINLNKVLSIESFNDAIGVKLENKQKPVYFRDINKYTVKIASNGNTKDILLSGVVLKGFIDVFIRYLQA